MARLDPAAGLADSFDPNPSGAVTAIVVHPDGKILVVGSFGASEGPGIGGEFRSRVARLDPVTGLADSFDPEAYSPNAMHAVVLYGLALQGDGKVLIGGDFTALNPNGGPQITRNHIARLKSDGRADQTLLDRNIVGSEVSAIAMQPDGKIIIGGNFNNVLGASRSNIARLNSDGSLDTVFDPGADGEVDAIAWDRMVTSW